tara:strand:+ start:268 stop:648 length:381 start_codon:yes stop_codon:yes gene_type:complete
MGVCINLIKKPSRSLNNTNQYQPKNNEHKLVIPESGMFDKLIFKRLINININILSPIATRHTLQKYANDTFNIKAFSERPTTFLLTKVILVNMPVFLSVTVLLLINLKVMKVATKLVRRVNKNINK